MHKTSSKAVWRRGASSTAKQDSKLAELAVRHQRGDVSAFGALCRELDGAMKQLIGNITIPPGHDASDAAQVVRMAWLSGVSSFHPSKGRLFPRLFRVAQWRLSSWASREAHRMRDSLVRDAIPLDGVQGDGNRELHELLEDRDGNPDVWRERMDEELSTARMRAMLTAAMPTLTRPQRRMIQQVLRHGGVSATAKATGRPRLDVERVWMSAVRAVRSVCAGITGGTDRERTFPSVL